MGRKRRGRKTEGRQKKGESKQEGLSGREREEHGGGGGGGKGEKLRKKKNQTCLNSSGEVSCVDINGNFILNLQHTTDLKYRATLYS